MVQSLGHGLCTRSWLEWFGNVVDGIFGCYFSNLDVDMSKTTSQKKIATYKQRYRLWKKFWNQNDNFAFLHKKAFSPLEVIFVQWNLDDLKSVWLAKHKNEEFYTIIQFLFPTIFSSFFGTCTFMWYYSSKPEKGKNKNIILVMRSFVFCSVPDTPHIIKNVTQWCHSRDVMATPLP